MKSLSERGKSLVRDMPPLMHAHFSIADKLYNSEKRPDGYLNLGTAENHLINSELVALVAELQKKMEIKPEHLHYDYSYGILEFREAVAEYWQNLVFGNDSMRKIKAENIVAGCGCSVALEMLASMLGDPGDVFLIPAPYYTGFEDDIKERAGIIPVPVYCGAGLDTAAFVEAAEMQQKAGRKVRAVLLSSPNNPTGTVYSDKALGNVIGFCMENDLDIISDEIYAQTVHNPDVRWVSMMKLVPEEYLGRIHVTSSFSKDFALSGFRTGFVISFNEALLKGMHVLSYYSNVSNHTQALLAALLLCADIPKIIEHGRLELGWNCRMICSELEKRKIDFVRSDGGIFLFANFSRFMAEDSFEAELGLWERIFNELRINISPGQIFRAAEPGWFRICYAHEPSVIEEFCRRLDSLN